MSRRTRKANVLRVTGIGAAALVVLVAGIRLASAAESNGAPSTAQGAAPTVNCPSVVDKLPAVPAAARAGASQELANLDREIAEANQRLITSRGQGGPNFIQNAIL